ncbi:MAG: monovalent cation/H+ antiporter complex subunit F [Actinomycetota bacterium]|nr:monovalent cation/H+ antiporter complex subunit F [Actinomycetota bacterium]
MTGWAVAALVLLVAVFGPALLLGSRGTAVERLVGLELAGMVTVLVLTLFAPLTGVSSLLVVPLTLVVLSFTGALVFLRLLGAGAPGTGRDEP